MYWANFLHFYQPPNQQDDILEAIVNQSYRRILARFKENPEALATINVSGGLLELLQEKGYEDVIQDLELLLQRGQIELTGTAMYHAFLPLLPTSEMVRQIQLNNEAGKRFFGNLYRPKGFFSPELAYDFGVTKIAKELGFSWIVAPEIAFPPGKTVKPQRDYVYQVKGLEDFAIFFRNKRVSVLILSGIVRSPKSLLKELEDETGKEQYILTIMDGETFGHHRPGMEEVLFNFYQTDVLKPVLVSDLKNCFKQVEKVEPRASTWSNEEQDFWLDRERKITSKNPFLLWNDPRNPIHKLQWEFTNWAIKKLKTQNSKLKSEIRERLDKALSSDQYWWASAKPWWSLEMIEQGAYQLREVINMTPEVSEEDRRRAEEYYHRILELAFDWQRRGIIRKKHKEAFGTFKQRPLKDRTPPNWYNLMILEFEDEMKKAAEKHEYEKAIKWRDAIIKLREGLDIYDVLHVVDDLRAVRTIPSLRSFWEHESSEFSEFAKSAFIDFDEEEFKRERPEKLKRLYQRQKAIEKGEIKFDEGEKYKV